MVDGTDTGTAADAATAAAKAAADKAVADSQAATAAAAQKAAADKAAADAAAAANKPPDKYDIKLGEGSSLEPAVVERTAAIARELGLGNTAAQKVLDTLTAETARRDAATLAAWEPLKGAAWLARDAELKALALADPMLGSGSPEKLAKAVEYATAAIKKFGGEEAFAFLQDLGLSSHPAALKMFATIGKGMAEGSLVLGEVGKAPTLSPAELFYGKTTPKG